MCGHSRGGIRFYVNCKEQEQVSEINVRNYRKVITLPAALLIFLLKNSQRAAKLAHREINNKFYRSPYQ